MSRNEPVVACVLVPINYPKVCFTAILPTMTVTLGREFDRRMDALIESHRTERRTADMFASSGGYCSALRASNKVSRLLRCSVSVPWGGVSDGV